MVRTDDARATAVGFAPNQTSTLVSAAIHDATDDTVRAMDEEVLLTEDFEAKHVSWLGNVASGSHEEPLVRKDSRASIDVEEHMSGQPEARSIRRGGVGVVCHVRILVVAWLDENRLLALETFVGPSLSHRSPTLFLVIERVDVVQHGRGANEALARALAEAKGGRPLAPVTVIVPSNFAGLSARRLLGAGLVGGSTGVANVDFFTPLRLAQQLAHDLLLDRRPLTNPVLGAAVRVALAEDPGPFERVADHHATEAALAQLTTELNQLTPGALGSLEKGAGPSVRQAVAFHRRLRGHLAQFDDEAHVARAAAGRSDLAQAVAGFGPIIWFLPEPVSSPLVELLGAVFAAAPTIVLAGLTGADDADGEIERLIQRVGGSVDARPVDEPPTATSIVSVTDADEEVRAVLREVSALMASGVDLDRIGIFYPTPDPYVRIITQQFAAAEVPANGPSRTRLADSAAGRSLLRALELPAVRWRRDRVMALVSGAPIRHGDSIARPSVWDAISREAGVVHDLRDWRVKLETRRKTITRDLEEQAEMVANGTPVPEWRLQRSQRVQSDVEALALFIDELAAAVQGVEQAEGWPAKVEAAGELLVSLLGADHQHGSWPEAEQEAFERIEDSLVRLSSLAEIEPTPSHAVFVRALTAELDVARARSGRFGHGVVFGPLSSAVGHDLDAVFVLGCAEGLCPSGRRDDVLLPDAARSLTNGELDLRLDQLGRQHRHLLAALASAPPDGRTMLFPRGDLRGSRHAMPSRWLLDSASRLRGSSVHATDFEKLPSSIVRVVPSHATGVVRSEHHASVHERDLSEVGSFVDGGGRAAHHPLAGGVTRGLEAQRARRSADFTEWDGHLAGQPIPSTADRPLSPSRLESWAACGYRYFLAHVLGLADRDDPERVIDLSPMDRGSGVHEVLERFVQEVIDRGAPDPGEPWTEEDRTRVRSLASEVFDHYEQRGRTGRPVRWNMTKSDLLALLDEFLTADDHHRAATRSKPAKVELPFGLGGEDPVELTLADGRVLRFRGYADRIDQAEDGRMLVSDYKTGKGKGYHRIDEGDPVQGGTTLQLGLYAEAARQALSADQVDAHYWMVNTEANHARFGYSWTAERRERMLEVLEVIADGIEHGVFPAVPGEYDTFRRTHEACTYCDFDSLCSRDRGELADATSGAVELRRRDGLIWNPDHDGDEQ